MSKYKLSLNDLESKPGTRYVRMVIDVWYNEKDDSIHITHGNRIYTTVNDKEGSVRNHRNLFKSLKSILEENEKWPKERKKQINAQVLKKEK